MKGVAWIAALASLLALVGPARAQVSIDIVDGQTTADWPSVGWLDTLSGSCTVTLIGCRTALTAAHCVCDSSGTGPACPDGTFLLDPADYLVFFQQAGDQDPFSPSFGQYPVESVQVAPDYEFGVTSDLALLELAFPVRGVAPAPFNTLVSPPNGTPSTIVGFGTTTFGGVDAGVKREGPATAASCVGSSVPDATHVCWSSSPDTTCQSDSGGPLFANVGAGITVAGVHSGSEDLCVSGEIAWDADVFVDRTWIDTAGGADLDVTGCGDGPQVGDAQVTTTSFSGVVATQANHSFPVAAGTKVLRVALNAELGSPPPNDNDFDLLLRFGAPPTAGTNDCFPALLGSFEYCEIPDPSPGTWFVRVNVFDGGPGVYQVTATRFPENPGPPALGTDDLLVTDFSSWEVMQVDGTTGDRAILSSPLRGSGSMLAAPEGVAVDPNGAILVANSADRSLLEIDPTTGDRTVLSGCTNFPCGTVVGSGPALLGPRFVAFEASDIVITDRGAPGIAAVVRIDSASGNRSVVSGCNNPSCSSVTGTGPAFNTPFGIAFEASDNLMVADAFALLEVDPANGNRTVISGCTDVSCTATVGSGEAFRRPAELAIEVGGDFLLADADAAAPAVFHVDAGSGDRTVISGCADAACNTTVGSGPPFVAGIIGLERVGVGTLLVTDGEQGTLFQVDRNTGNRTVLSGCVNAGCTSAAGSGPLFTSPTGVSLALPEPDVGLGLLAGIGLLAALRRWRGAAPGEPTR